RFGVSGKGSDVEEAVRVYQQGLQIVSAVFYPEQRYKLADNLGDLHFEQQQYAAARAAFQEAHAASEAMRLHRQADSQQKMAGDNARMYARLIACCLQANDITAAFNYAAAAKGRAFTDALATTRSDFNAIATDNPAFAPHWQMLQTRQRQIDQLLTLRTSDRLSAADRQRCEQQIYQLREEERKQWDQLAYEFPTLTATVTAPTLTASEALTLAHRTNLTLVEYYRHEHGWCAFIAAPHSDQIEHVLLPELDNSQLLDWAVSWLKSIETRAYRHTLHRRLLPALYRAAIAPLISHLPNAAGHVLLAPFHWLHLMPLSATLAYCDPDATWAAAFMPSLGAFKVLHTQMQRDETAVWQAPQNLLSIAYPGTGRTRLPNVLPEAQGIAQWFDAARVTKLHEADAQPDQVLDHARHAHAAHFGCHSYFDTARPNQSGFVLSGGWLTARQIVTQLHLDNAQLATLASCRSNYNTLDSGDNFTNLMQAIMTAGAPIVAASLWSVDDAATRLLFEAFYQQLRAGITPHRALQAATDKLREEGWTHPYYWAAFRLTGLPYPATAQAISGWPPAIDTLYTQKRRERLARQGVRTMNSQDMIVGAEALLEDITASADLFTTDIPDTELATFVALLGDLQTAAAQMQTQADLLALADAVQIVLTELPHVRAWLFEPETNHAAEAQQRISFNQSVREDPAQQQLLDATPTLSNDIDWTGKAIKKKQPDLPQPDPTQLQQIRQKLQSLFARIQQNG
ncbi:MAG: CHAT domain-containing protein, partial [Candidatus Promineifilaceae bacterium]